MDRSLPTPQREALAQALWAVRSEMEYDRWMYEIPYLRFPASWAVQVIPPFGGAVVRFCVRNRSGREVSVYLDCYGALGGERGHSYWEISPSADGDPERFGMEDVAGLLAGLRRSLRKRGPGAEV